jgi:hypothetical protein
VKRTLKGAGFNILPLFIFVSIVSGKCFPLTLGVYFAADNDLASQADVDLEEIRTSPCCEKVNVVIFADRGIGSTNPGTFIYVKRDTFLVQIREFGNLDSGDPSTLNFFIRYLRDNYPSDQYGLVLWGHGTSWMKVANPFSKSIAFDATSGNYIDVFNGELKWAIPDSIFSFIIMDACLMGGIEVLWELQGKAKYVVASPALVPATGLNYRKILMDSNSVLRSLVSFLQRVVWNYVVEYDSLDYTVSMSLYDLERLNESKFIIERLVNESYYTSSFTLMKYRLSSLTYNLYSNEVQDSFAPFVDLTDFLGKFQYEPFPFIIYSKGNGVFESACGVSAYFPLSLLQIRENYVKYRKLAFERETHFLDVVINTIRDEYFSSVDTLIAERRYGKRGIEVSFPGLVKASRWNNSLLVYKDNFLRDSVTTVLSYFLLKLAPGNYRIELRVFSPLDGRLAYFAVFPDTFVLEESDTPYYNSVVDSLPEALDITGRKVRREGRNILFRNRRKYLVF